MTSFSYCQLPTTWTFGAWVVAPCAWGRRCFLHAQHPQGLGQPQHVSVSSTSFVYSSSGASVTALLLPGQVSRAAGGQREAQQAQAQQSPGLLPGQGVCPGEGQWWSGGEDPPLVPEAGAWAARHYSYYLKTIEDLWDRCHHWELLKLSCRLTVPFWLWMTSEPS